MVAVLEGKTLRIYCLKKAWAILSQIKNAIFDYTHGTVLHCMVFYNNFLGIIPHKYMIFIIPTSQSKEINETIYI